MYPTLGNKLCFAMAPVHVHDCHVSEDLNQNKWSSRIFCGTKQPRWLKVRFCTEL